ncbi:MAG TPA: winged helix DNA-binding domain-containing protein [Candidatus Limnocylindria bacterium]|nr:winged helix DNA-binding domain-containing protein [Candidatus Limnocylindria bacterium]
MSAALTWPQVLTWRMRRQLVDPVGKSSVPEVVRRLCGVQAQVASSAELAIRLRRTSSRRGEVARALSEGRLIKTWAMRGTLHLLTPEEGGAFLSLMASGRSWEKPSWERYFGMTSKHWDALRPAVREALDGELLTRDELITAITAQRGLSHIGDALRSGWGTLLKPLAWQGDLCFGPNRGSRVTFMRPPAASSRWAGVLEPDQAAPIVIVAYFGAYGPATIENFRNWLSRGRVSARQIRTWFNALGGRLAEVNVEGRRVHILAEHLDELAATKPSKTVRLLPGFDQYVLGPGTEDGHVVPPKRRTAVSRQAGWIAPIVVGGGSVKGTWALDGDHVRVGWFKEAGTPPRTMLKAEVERLSSILDRDLRAEIGVV